MLYLFLIIIVLGLLAAMLTAFVKLIRDLGELAALLSAWGSGAENKDGQDAGTSADSSEAAYNHLYAGRYYLQERALLRKRKQRRLGRI